MVSPTPLIGEPLALDLVNTRPRTPRGTVDLLATTAGLRAWLSLEADRVPGISEETASALGEEDLRLIHAVREHAAGALDHRRRGEAPAAAALRGLNQALRAAPAIRELHWDGTAVVAPVRRTGPFAIRLAAQLAEAVADLLSDPAAADIKACEAEDCVMLFLPTHPRRRWCSASRCGNRVRVARYYEKHKAI